MTPANSTFAEVSLQGYMNAAANQQAFAFYPVLPRRVVSMLGGHGGAGKTDVGLTLAAHGGCARSFGGYEPEGELRCVFVTLEDEPDRVRSRLRDITSTFGLDEELISSNLRVLDGTALGLPLAREASNYGARSLERTSLLDDLAAIVNGADLIVIDNASDAFDGDENSRRQVRTFIRMLTEIARDADAAILLLAHIDKMAARNGARGQTYSGSTAWHNSVRSRLALIDREDKTELVHEKSNFTCKAATVSLRRNDRGVLIPTFGEEQFPSENDVAAALALIKAARAAGKRVPTATRGPLTAWTVLSGMPEMAPFTRGRAQRERLSSALLHLFFDGRLARSDYWDAHRNRREEWVLVAENPVPSERSDIACFEPNTSASSRSLVPQTPVKANARTRQRDSCISQSGRRAQLTTTDEVTKRRQGSVDIIQPNEDPLP